ncbi:MAG: hypothetical protein IPK70_04335 [Flavobacteriales bacterium]|jgi:hypothetical protein|nr:hypothetical protein [Flavobacteriales bacterium]
MITHDLLDAYESVKGDYTLLPWGLRPDEALWEAVDGLVLELHLIEHGYASDGYAKHVERELRKLCADAGVAQRMKAMRL